jgi:DNA-binding transcriptional LysR family regulator
MALSSSQLEAFAEVARTGNFSRAAAKLRLTQSALSQRVLNLEGELGVSLFVREPRRLRLTEAGQTLFKHCQLRSELESEALEQLHAERRGSELSGVLRLAGYSTVVWSVAVPALGELVRKHPGVQVEMAVREMRELPGLLRSGEADFILMDRDLGRPDLERKLLGHEDYVRVASARKTAREEVFLDHDAEDETSRRFLGREGRLDRSFLDDIYGILAGVEQGWGSAVVPRHLVEGRSGLRVVPSKKALRSPVWLQYYRQPYYSRLHSQVIAALEQNAGRYLG